MPTPHSQSSSKIWYFVFGAAQGVGLPWYQKICMLTAPKNFRHVNVFCQMGPRILRIDTVHNDVMFSEEYMEADHAQEIPADVYGEIWGEKEGITVVKYEFKPNFRSLKNITCIIPSCVTVARLSTGIDTLSVTPLQLYRFLLNSGGTVITKENK